MKKTRTLYISVLLVMCMYIKIALEKFSKVIHLKNSLRTTKKYYLQIKKIPPITL